ncbi:MAG: acetylglutamate kinase [Peptococcia bacterium]|jgi:hypothetical protein
MAQQTSFLYLNNLMRMLWEQHAAWTRMTIISIAEGLADEELTTQRLLRNPGDIAAVFQCYYGNQIAECLKNLLTDHLVLAAQLVKASKTGDTTAAADIERKWYANGEQIATFLSRINSFWSREVMSNMWRIHLDQVKAQAVARLNKDYASDIHFYDIGELHLLHMADLLTQGIVRQFPQCFATR